MYKTIITIALLMPFSSHALTTEEYFHLLDQEYSENKAKADESTTILNSYLTGLSQGLTVSDATNYARVPNYTKAFCLPEGQYLDIPFMRKAIQKYIYRPTLETKNISLAAAFNAVLITRYSCKPS